MKILKSYLQLFTFTLLSLLILYGCNLHKNRSRRDGIVKIEPEFQEHWNSLRDSYVNTLELISDELKQGNEGNLFSTTKNISNILINASENFPTSGTRRPIELLSKYFNELNTHSAKNNIQASSLAWKNIEFELRYISKYLLPNDKDITNTSLSMTVENTLNERGCLKRGSLFFLRGMNLGFQN